MNKFFRCLLAFVFGLMLLAFGVFAEEDFDGYIVALSDSISEYAEDNCAVLFGDGEVYGNYSAEYAAELLSDGVDGISEVRADKGLVKADSLETLEMLKQAGIVKYYDKNVYAELYGYDPELNTYYSEQWYLPTVKAEYAWNAGIFGNSVRVGVIDSGVYPNADLAGCLADGYNYALDSTDAVGYEYNHGTGVASVIAAQCNDIGTVGIAHKATIVPLRVVGSDGKIPVVYIISAIYGAVDDFDCDVINMSLGIKTSTPSVSLKDAVDYAESKGCIMVAAAGNGGADKEFPYNYPASFDNVISVANVQQNSDGSYSIRSTSQKNDKLDIAAPGTNIYMANNDEDGTFIGNGTSFACPVVAAAAALVKSVDPQINQSDFMYYLKETADSSYLKEEFDSNSWGAGMLDIEALLKAVLIADGKKAYVSRIDVSPFDGSSSVYINNPTSGRQTYSIVLKAVRPKYKAYEFELAPYKSLEISLSSDIKCYGNTSVSVYDSGGRSIAVQTHGFAEPDYETFEPGDVNADGKVDHKDVLLLQMYLAKFGGLNLSDEALQCADVFTDGVVDSRDIVRLLQYLSGWAVELG